jgi:hypothetical protein
VTSRAIKQEKETYDKGVFQVATKGRRPMVEKKAGADVWLQGTVLCESVNEVKVKVQGNHISILLRLVVDVGGPCDHQGWNPVGIIAHLQG